jgi:hypothetical protein
MKSKLISALIIFAGFSGYAQNPIIQTKFTADPAPLVYKDKVFLYTSHDEDNAPPGQGKFLMRDWLCYTSTDMVNWTDHGTVASLRNFKWADKALTGWGGFDNGAWAPQVIERDGKFFMYCPVQGRGIGVLVADNPLGPFTDPLDKPLINGKFDSIDPTVFVDDDGQAYLYWGNPNLWYVKLNRDMVSFAGEPVKDPGLAKVKDQKDPFHYQEGPWVYKRNGKYYMAYASTCCPEGIGYAMSDSPTGPWAFKGYIMQPNRKSTGNHPGIIDYKGRSYVFGFNFRLNFLLTEQHYERRSVCVEEFTYNSDGTIPELPWWREEGIKPAGTLDPYQLTQAETIAWASGLKTDKDSATGTLYVTSTHNNDHFSVRSVDLGKGARSIKANLAGISGGVIEIRADSLQGALLGTCTIKKGNGKNWDVVSAKLKPLKDVHDIYFVFKGGDGELCNFDWWKMSR